MSGRSYAHVSAGVPVVLHEMRPVRGTDAHQTDGLAELADPDLHGLRDWLVGAASDATSVMVSCASTRFGGSSTPVDPVLQALAVTGLVVAVSATSFALSLTSARERHHRQKSGTVGDDHAVDEDSA